MAHIFLIPRATVVCSVILLYVAVLIRESNGRPPWTASSKVFTESAECHTDDELLELCQRCAKLTKSTQALPACCSTDLKARQWCSDFVYFGRDQYDF